MCVNLLTNFDLMSGKICVVITGSLTILWSFYLINGYIIFHIHIVRIMYFTIVKNEENENVNKGPFIPYP